jgi:hypothetical protein
MSLIVGFDGDGRPLVLKPVIAKHPEEVPGDRPIRLGQHEVPLWHQRRLENVQQRLEVDAFVEEIGGEDHGIGRAQGRGVPVEVADHRPQAAIV